MVNIPRLNVGEAITGAFEGGIETRKTAEGRVRAKADVGNNTA